MSIKIYNGFKIDDLTTFLLELNQYKRSIIKNYDPKGLTEWCALRYFNDQNVFENKKPNIPFERYVQTLRQDFEKNKHVASEHYENKYDVSISYSPVHQIGMIHAEETDHDTYISHFNSVQDYNYYNNSDKPKYLSDEEWSEREETWSNILNKGYTPGVGYHELLHIDVFTEPFDYTTIIQTYEKHKAEFLRNYLEQNVIDNAVTLFGSENDRYTYNQYNANEQYHAMLKLARKLYTQNDQGKRYIQDNIENYKALLNQ